MPSVLELHVWDVFYSYTYDSNNTGRAHREVTAAYHIAEDNGMTVFKDDHHSAVYSVASDALIEILRRPKHLLLPFSVHELELVCDSIDRDLHNLDDMPDRNYVIAETNYVALHDARNRYGLILSDFTRVRDSREVGTRIKEL